MTFRFDINALRAISILAVIFYHFKVPFFTGGFIGVDVFFVISGYLMTKIIFEKIEGDRFTLLDFYLDRAYRIIPALAFLCLFLLIAGWFVLYPIEYQQLSKEIISAMFFTSNFLYWRESGYFDASADQLYLLHAWSLAVEWQFYLLYPIFILLINLFFGLKKGRYILLLFFIFSLFMSAYLSGKYPTFSFYLLPTRSWEMLAGAAIFLFPFKNTYGINRATIQFIGLIVIMLGLFFLDESMYWPGLWALIPVAGAYIFISAQAQNSFISKNRQLQFLGKSSYSIYLWHWPIIIWLSLNGYQDEWSFILFGIVASIIIGYISYITIERYFLSLKKRHINERKKLIILISCLYLLSYPSYAVYKNEGIDSTLRPINNDEKSIFLKGYEELHKNGLNDAYLLKCDFYDHKTKSSRQEIDKSCTNVEKGNKNVIFVWGDSHAQALSYGLRLNSPMNFSFAQVATSGCPPSLTIFPRSSKIVNNCGYANQFALKEIERIEPRIVILAQSDFHEEVEWEELAIVLRNKGVERVILVGPIPQYKPSLPSVVIRHAWQSESQYISVGLDYKVIETSRILEKQYSENGFLTYISLTEKLCNADGCRAFVNLDEKSLMLVDYGHLSPKGSLIVSQIIFEKLFSSINPTK